MLFCYICKILEVIQIMFREILSYIAEFCRGMGVNLVIFINIVK